jgi:hypothetical protein
MHEDQRQKIDAKKKYQMELINLLKKKNVYIYQFDLMEVILYTTIAQKP